MKTIELHTAVVDNGGARRDAGEQLAIGTKPGQVTEDRAKEMVASGRARTVREAASTSAKKPAAKKASPKTKATPKPAEVPASSATSTAASASSDQ